MTGSETHNCGRRQFIAALASAVVVAADDHAQGEGLVETCAESSAD